MVNPGKALGRALIGSLFIYGGRNALVNRQHLTGLIDNAQETYGVKEKVPATSEQLIQANGAGMIALGAAMGLGIKSRLAAIGLLPLLAATTVSAHNFWDIKDDPQARNQQMTAFFGNLAAAGGLVTVIMTKN